MKRSTDRILTTHVGSLVRPVEVREFIEAKEKGQKLDEAEFQKVLRREVKAVVKKQADTGIDIVNDGEYGKPGWIRYVAERMEGLVLRDVKPGERIPDSYDVVREASVYPEFYKAYYAIMFYDWLPPGQTKFRLGPDVPPAPPSKVWDCSGPISYRGQAMIRRDIADLKEALEEVKVEEAFLPVAAPMSARGLWLNSYYKSEDEVFEALAGALREEYKAIVEAGFVLQIDDAFIAHEYDRLLAKMDEKQVIRHCEMCVELLNRALEGIPEDRVRYHVCWGSWAGPHVTDIPLKTLVNLVLKVKAQAYSLEAANPRHEHEWQVWKDVKLPDGKILIPGVVTHSTNVVEHPELVALRLKNFAGVVGRENVIGGTDCGFAQSYNVVRVHPSVMWAKLEALAEGARLASKELWAK
jgi:5-methyltetrahydropteroyltriglutamate--homocysteine methyltransferase